MTSCTIFTQPPARIHAAERLRALIVLASSSDAVVHFAIAALHNANNTTEGRLDGDALAIGRAIKGHHGVTVFVFENLAISYPGIYTIRVGIYEVTLEGATLTYQVESGTISVFNSQVLRHDSSESCT